MKKKKRKEIFNIKYHTYYSVSQYFILKGVAEYVCVLFYVYKLREKNVYLCVIILKIEVYQKCVRVHL